MTNLSDKVLIRGVKKTFKRKRTRFGKKEKKIATVSVGKNSFERKKTQENKAEAKNEERDAKRMYNLTESYPGDF